MTTNINKLQQLYDMQLHTAETVNNLLENHLPFGYSTAVKRIAAKQGISLKPQRIREVKSLIQKDLQILNLLIEYAKENQAVAEAGKTYLNSLLAK